MPNMKNIIGLKTAAQPEGGEDRPSDASSISGGVEHTGTTMLNAQEQPLMVKQTQMPPMTRLSIGHHIRIQLLHQNIKTKQNIKKAGFLRGH